MYFDANRTKSMYRILLSLRNYKLRHFPSKHQMFVVLVFSSYRVDCFHFVSLPHTRALNFSQINWFGRIKGKGIFLIFIYIKRFSNKISDSYEWGALRKASCRLDWIEIVQSSTSICLVEYYRIVVTLLLSLHSILITMIVKWCVSSFPR